MLMAKKSNNFEPIQRRVIVKGVLGSSTKTVGEILHEQGTFFMNKPQYQFDQDPFGMDMPYKEFITEDGTHPRLDGRRVRYEFPNGYGASVIQGDMFYTDKDHPYEVCPLYRGKMDYGAIEPDRQDVYPYQTDEELIILLSKLQALPTPQGEEK